MKTKVETKTSQHQILVTISDDVTEESQLPSIQLAEDQKLIIHFQGVHFINSGGVRNWVKWVSEIEKAYPAKQVSMLYLPSLFVRYNSVLENFLPKQSDVRSFVVPYFCHHCNHSMELVLEKADLKAKVQAEADFEKVISETTCPACGKAAEIDTSPNQYKILL